MTDNDKGKLKKRAVNKKKLKEHEGTEQGEKKTGKKTINLGRV